MLFSGRRFGLALLVLLVACGSAVAGPASARVSGIVVDASGAPVPGATVAVRAAGQAVVLATTADDGGFEVTDVPPGEVLVVVRAPGFAESARHVSTSARDMPRFVLQPAGLTDQLTVTASRGVERLGGAGSVTVLSSAELLNAGAPSLDDALRNTPGFSLFRRSSSRVSNPTTQGVTLRGVSGSGASRTMVLADGLPLNDAFGSWVYWNRVPGAAIERVEVIRGATGDLYGADALGGVVQVLTFAPGRTRLRAMADAGSHDTRRVSAFGGTHSRGWHLEGAGEWVATEGVRIIAPEARGPVDVPADSDYATGFLGGGYHAGAWHANLRVSLYEEDRGNGTPLQVNGTEWRQVAVEAGGAAAAGAWLARASGGTQDYYQTFTAVAADRRSERLTTEQGTPSSFATFLAQWSRSWGPALLLAGAEGKRTESTVQETRYSFIGVPSGPFLAGGTETNGAAFGRVSVEAAESLTLAAGARVDAWRSSPLDAQQAEHSSMFLSPRLSAAFAVSELVSLQASTYRAYRTPTLNELHRGFRVGNIVTNANPRLDPERLTGVEGGVLVASSRASVRATAYWNQLDEAIANVTIATVPGLITRQRQNTDTVRAAGVEIETEIRPTRSWTINALAALTRSTFSNTPAQPALEGNRVPQVPSYQVGGGVTYVGGRGFTGSAQVRVSGEQFDDDLNQFALGAFMVMDASVSQALRRGFHLFFAVENLFDADYDVGRTPIRSVGWPRSVRAGARLFLP